MWSNYSHPFEHDLEIGYPSQFGKYTHDIGEVGLLILKNKKTSNNFIRLQNSHQELVLLEAQSIPIKLFIH